MMLECAHVQGRVPILTKYDHRHGDDKEDVYVSRDL